jgi:hypothetical protein
MSLLRDENGSGKIARSLRVRQADSARENVSDFEMFQLVSVVCALEPSSEAASHARRLQWFHIFEE